jgi:hypothetical protein
LYAVVHKPEVSKAARGKIQPLHDLFPGHVEPFDDLVNAGHGFQVLDPVAQQADDVIRSDDPGETLLVVNHGESNKIVFVEHLGHVFV